MQTRKLNQMQCLSCVQSQSSSFLVGECFVPVTGWLACHGAVALCRTEHKWMNCFDVPNTHSNCAKSCCPAIFYVASCVVSRASVAGPQRCQCTCLFIINCEERRARPSMSGCNELSDHSSAGARCTLLSLHTAALSSPAPCPLTQRCIAGRTAQDSAIHQKHPVMSYIHMPQALEWLL